MNPIVVATPRPVLDDLCNQVDALLHQYQAPGRVIRGTWADTHVVLDFEPQSYTPCRAVYAALPALSLALGVTVQGERKNRGVQLTIPLATRKSPRHF